MNGHCFIADLADGYEPVRSAYECSFDDTVVFHLQTPGAIYAEEESNVSSRYATIGKLS